MHVTNETTGTMMVICAIKGRVTRSIYKMTCPCSDTVDFNGQRMHYVTYKTAGTMIVICAIEGYQQAEEIAVPFNLKGYNLISCH